MRQVAVTTCIVLTWVGTSWSANLATLAQASGNLQAPDSRVIRLNPNYVYYGRTHFNGSNVSVPMGNYPVIHGLYSQVSPTVANLDEADYPEIFVEGWATSHTPLDLDFSETVQSIRDTCLEEHHWRGNQDSLSLTTLIRFDGPVYHAAQYAESQISESDTLWHVPWTTLPLPGPDESQLIWVDGVARVKGIVSGQVTLLASDSLFIMGDLITADTDTTNFDEARLFGTSPIGSPHRIGLISERDVILAATLENGFGNGVNTPDVTCGFSNHPVIHSSAHHRANVVLNASILALGCCFETEFWKTTAWMAEVYPPMTQLPGCEGQYNTYAEVWDNVPGGIRPDCLGNTNGWHDNRGTFWFNGSLVGLRSGIIASWPPSPLGDVTIGYLNQKYRHDPNLLDFAPPYWPEAKWEDDPPMQIGLESTTPCGPVALPAMFAAEWLLGHIRLVVEPIDAMDDLQQSALLLTRINDEVVDSTWFTIDDANSTAQWNSSRDLTPWLEQDVELRLEVQRGAWFTLPDSSGFFEPLFYWNANGEECSWSWNATTVEVPPTPADFTLSNPWPNPFNPVTQVELTLSHTAELTLEVHDLLGRRETLLHTGILPAGTRTFTIDGSDWAAGLHMLTLRHAGGVETRKLLLLK